MATHRHELGAVILAVAAAMMTVLNLNGLDSAVRGIIAVFLMILFILGLACFRDMLPPKYRGRVWATRRLAELHSEREALQEQEPMPMPFLMSESDIEAFDLQPGARNYGTVNVAREVPLDREDLRLQRQTEMEIAELTERLGNVLKVVEI